MSELQKAVADMLVKATQAAEAAGKFAIEQLPDVAHQYVMYIGIVHTLWVVFGFFLLGLVVWCIKQGRKYDEDGYFIVAVFGTVAGVMCIGFSISTAIMAFVAPKVLLIQWAAELVK